MASFSEHGNVRFHDSVASVPSETKSGRARPAGGRPQPSARRESSASRRSAGHRSRREDTSNSFPEEPTSGEQAREAVLLESKAAPSAPAPSFARPTPPPKKSVDTSPEAAVSRLLHAIALKEAQTARLIHVEVEKAERASRQAMGAVTFEDALALHRSAADMMYAIAHKEELLVSKLTVLLGIVETMAGVRTGGQDEELEQEHVSFLFQPATDSDTDS